MHFKKIIGMLLISFATFAADFTIDVNPAASSVDDSKVSSLSISKITNLQSSLDAKVESSSLVSTLTNYFLKSDIKTPKMFSFLSGSGTYTPSAGTLYIKVRMIGGGGGGAGGGVSNTMGIGGNGGATTLGSLTANGGNGGREGDSMPGGTASCGSISYCKAFQGGWGGGFGYKQPDAGAMTGGGQGASSPFGGEGGAASDRSGNNAIANTGSGGGGGDSFGGCASNCRAGGGGAAGGYIEAMILNPGAMFFSIGTSGSAGSAGSNGGIGGLGGSGILIIEEFFQ